MKLPAIINHWRSRLLVMVILAGTASATVSISVAQQLAALFAGALAEVAEPVSALRWLLPLLAAMIVLPGLSIIQRMLSETLGQDYVGEMRRCVFEYLIALPDDQREKLRRGTLMTRFSNDLTAIRNWLVRGIAEGATGLIITLILGAYLTWLHLPLGLGLIGLLGVVATVTLLIGRRLNSTIRLARRARGRLSAYVGERIACIDAVRETDMRERSVHLLDQRHNRLATALLHRAGWTEATHALTAAFAVLAPLLVVVEVLVRSPGSLSPADTVAAMTIAGLLGSPMARLSLAYTTRQNFLVAQRMLLNVLRRPVQPMQSVGQGDIGQAAKTRAPFLLQLSQLGWRAGRTGITGSVRRGDRIVLQGQSGSGKTWLLRALAGFARTPEGALRWQDQEMNMIDRESIHRAVALVSSDSVLIKGSIGRNLGLSNRNAERLHKVLHDAGIVDEGFGSQDWQSFRVAEGGANVSGGLHLKISLARALARPRKVILIDDFDQIADQRTRASVMRLWRSSRAAMIIVTQEPSVAADADTQWNLDAQHLHACSVGKAAEIDLAQAA